MNIRMYAAAPATFVLIGALLAPAAARPAAASLCEKGEQAVFDCRLGARSASVCAVPGPGAKMVYRFGRPGEVELSLPAAGGAAPKFSSTAYSGGGEAHLRFSNGAYDYIVFDRTVRTNFTPGGTNDPAFTAGLVVRKAGRKLSTAACRNDASLAAFAYENLPREDFEDLALPSP